MAIVGGPGPSYRPARVHGARTVIEQVAMRRSSRHGGTGFDAFLDTGGSYVVGLGVIALLGFAVFSDLSPPTREIVIPIAAQ